MVVDGVFERFPKLRVATIEAMVRWVGEWLERVAYRYKYMGHNVADEAADSRVFRSQSLG
jgi:predicted TIM-barrel fold metal-dependent hydrolase